MFLRGLWCALRLPDSYSFRMITQYSIRNLLINSVLEPRSVLLFFSVIHSPCPCTLISLLAFFPLCFGKNELGSTGGLEGGPGGLLELQVAYKHWFWLLWATPIQYLIHIRSNIVTYGNHYVEKVTTSGIGVFFYGHLIYNMHCPLLYNISRIPLWKVT